MSNDSNGLKPLFCASCRRQINRGKLPEALHLGKQPGEYLCSACSWLEDTDQDRSSPTIDPHFGRENR